MAQKTRATHIANFILDSADRDGVQDVSILKLLKLVYIFFGWSAVLRPDSEYLFSDPIEAWKYGPVVPSLYYELREDGAKIQSGLTLMIKAKLAQLYMTH